MPSASSNWSISRQSKKRSLTESHDGGEDEQKYAVAVQNKSEGACQTLQGHVLSMRPSACKVKSDLKTSPAPLDSYAAQSKAVIKASGAAAPYASIKHLATTAPALLVVALKFACASFHPTGPREYGATCRPGLTPAAGTPGAQVLNQPPGKDGHCEDQNEHSNDHHGHIRGMVCMHRPGCHGVAGIIWAKRGSKNAICVVKSCPPL